MNPARCLLRVPHGCGPPAGSPLRRSVRWATAAGHEGGRYGHAERKASTVAYEPEELAQSDKVSGARTRRPFILGATMRGMINRSRQRLGLPAVYDWRKFTSEAVKVQSELCGLDDPRALQQVERERRAKSGSTLSQKRDQSRTGLKKKQFSHLAQTSSMMRAPIKTHPIQELMNKRQFKDSVAISRIVNESNKESICAAWAALGKPTLHPSRVSYVPRAPVITIMGHVDHGKTTLLDYLKKSDIASGEAGGITQSIGAFQVTVPGSDVPITFIDTPGHAAFANMRQAGLNATDIVVLVLSAVDGIQPQTVEVIQAVQAAGLPLVVAFNKIDRVQDVEGTLVKLHNELRAQNVVLEEDGGDVLSCGVSAKTGQGVGDLLENIMMQAELLELQTAVPCRAEAQVLENTSVSTTQSNTLNPTFTNNGRVNVIVKRGVLAPGMNIVSGEHMVKITGLFDDAGNALKQALPSQPCAVTGFGRRAPGPNSIIADAGRRVQPKEWKAFWDALQRAKSEMKDLPEIVSNQQAMLFWEPRADIPDEVCKRHGAACAPLPLPPLQPLTPPHPHRHCPCGKSVTKLPHCALCSRRSRRAWSTQWRRLWNTSRTLTTSSVGYASTPTTTILFASVKGTTILVSPRLSILFFDPPLFPLLRPQVISKGVGDIDDTDGQLYQQRPDMSQIVGVGIDDKSLDTYEVCIIYEIKLRACKHGGNTTTTTPPTTAPPRSRVRDLSHDRRHQRAHGRFLPSEDGGRSPGPC